MFTWDYQPESNPNPDTGVIRRPAADERSAGKSADPATRPAANNETPNANNASWLDSHLLRLRGL